MCSADSQWLQAITLKVPPLAISNTRGCWFFFFFNLRRLTSLNPLPVGAQMAAKGMLERFISYLGDDKPGFRRERRDCLCKSVWTDPVSLTKMEGFWCSLWCLVLWSSVLHAYPCSLAWSLCSGLPSCPDLSFSISNALEELGHVTFNQSLLDFVGFCFSVFFFFPTCTKLQMSWLSTKGDFLHLVTFLKLWEDERGNNR